MAKRKSQTRPLSRRAPSTVSATEAQNNFGRVLGQAASGGIVYITRYDEPAAVVLSVERYRALTTATDPDLDELAAEFDERVARMQSHEAAEAVDALFAGDSETLGRIVRERSETDERGTSADGASDAERRTDESDG